MPGRITWVLWCACVLMILVSILFQQKNSNDMQTMSSAGGLIGEHIPENATDDPEAEEPARIEQENEDNTVPEGAENIENAVFDNAEKNDDETPDVQEPDVTVPVGPESEEMTEPERDGDEEINAGLETDETGTEDSENKDDSEIMLPDETESEILLPKPEKREIDPQKPMVALTFDDGPHKKNTKIIMDVLEQYDGRATFFVVGYHVDSFPEVVQDAYTRGFQIGNHTMSHVHLSTLAGEKALVEEIFLNRKLNEIGVAGKAMLRPPYGDYTDYLQENLSVPMIGWNVDSKDWSSGNVDAIYNEVVGKVKDGDIILFHDIYDTTAEAIQRIVPELAAQGFQLVTVEELFEAKGKEPKAGRYYYYVR